MAVYTGRPENTEGRIENEIKSYDFLDKAGISYYRVDHEAHMNMESCKEVDEELGTTLCKNLVLCNRQRTNFYLLMMPGDKKFLTKDLSKQLGVARLSFASDDYLKELLDVTPGSVSILCLMNDPDRRVRLLIEEEVLAGEYVGFHPCINTTSLRVKTEDLKKKIIPLLGHDLTVVKL